VIPRIEGKLRIREGTVLGKYFAAILSGVMGLPYRTTLLAVIGKR